MKRFEMCPEYFGPFWKFVSDDSIVDVDWNGRQLWLRNMHGRKWKENVEITDLFLRQFCQRVANLEEASFNANCPELEADTERLRITCVLGDAASTGTCVFIRKSQPKVRLTEEGMIRDGYCSKQIHDLIVNCIRADMSVIVCGSPGVGKTELEKYLSRSINPNARAVVIEDNNEWHYEKINPEKDCVSIKVDEVFSYTDAIKASLRMNTDWLIVAEVRSVETTALIEAASTGLHTITSLHTGDVRDIPDRILSMMGNPEAADRLENDIYRDIDVGILVRWKKTDDGQVRRAIDQVCFFTREDGENRCSMIAMDGGILPDAKIPASIRKQFERSMIKDPFTTGRGDGQIE